MEKMEELFLTLYSDATRSKSPKLIKTSDNVVYHLINYKTNEYAPMQEDILNEHSVIDVNIYGKPLLHSKNDVQAYVLLVRGICKNYLNMMYNYDFVKPSQMIKCLVQNSLKSKIIIKDPSICENIDKASGGGCLIAKKGYHEGEYTCFDINNSYNAIFINYNIASNPKYKTVTEIDKSDKFLFSLYKLRVSKPFLADEYSHMFKTKRIWFTWWDVKIFDDFGITYELVQEENNKILFCGSVESDFSWMETLNAEKQKTDKKTQAMKCTVLKNLLSSVWGEVCRYKVQELYTVDEVLPPHVEKQNPYIGELGKSYLYNAHPKTGESYYIDPRCFYRYAVGIMKPFVLAYGRYRLLKQVLKLKSKGYDVIYCHTDSIITNAPAKCFDIGGLIGQWKIDTEKSATKGVKINNIISKEFFN